MARSEINSEMKPCTIRSCFNCILDRKRNYQNYMNKWKRPTQSLSPWLFPVTPVPHDSGLGLFASRYATSFLPLPSPHPLKCCWLYWTKIPLWFYKILDKTLLTKESLHWKDGCRRFESIMHIDWWSAKRLHTKSRPFQTKRSIDEFQIIVIA